MAEKSELLDKYENELIEKLGKKNFKHIFKNEASILLEFGIEDREIVISTLHKRYFENMDSEENPHEKFVNKWKSKLQMVVNDSSFKDNLIESAKIGGKYRTFKFGKKSMAKVEKEHRYFSEEDFEGYVFVLSVFQNFHEQYGKFTSVLFLLWNDINSTPKVYSCIPPKCFSQIATNNSYNRLYYIQYKGLKQSETNKDRSYHYGSVLPIVKINRLVQKSLK